MRKFPTQRWRDRIGSWVHSYCLLQRGKTYNLTGNRHQRSSNVGTVRFLLHEHIKVWSGWDMVTKTDGDSKRPISAKKDTFCCNGSCFWKEPQMPLFHHFWCFSSFQSSFRATDDEMVGWHYRLKGHEFEQTPGDNEGQGSLVCCSPWCCRLGHDWVTEQQKQLSVFFHQKHKDEIYGVPKLALVFSDDSFGWTWVSKFI